MAAGAEGALESSERPLRALFDQAPAFIALHEGPHHVYVFSNPLHDRIAGGRLLIGKTLREAFPELEGQGIFERFDRVYQTGEADVRREMPATFARTPDGPPEAGYFDQVLCPWRGEEGDVRGVMSFAFEVTEAVRAKRRLEESERRFRGTFDNAAVGVAHVDQAGRWTYVNDALCRMLGYTRKELLARTFGDVSHPDDVEVSQERFGRLMRGEVAQHVLEKRYLHKSGRVVWVRLTASLAPDVVGKPQYNIAIVEDVTERKRAEQALRESEARLRTLFSSIDEGYCLCEMVLDTDGRPTDYRFLEVNPLFEAMTGLADAAGRTAYELVPGLEPHWVETYARVALGGEPLRFEQGSEAMGRWFDAFATPVEPRGQFALVFKDVTERKWAERALKESEERFRGTFDNAAVGIAHVGLDGSWLRVNDRLCAITGYSREALLEKTFQEITHPDDLGPDQEQFDRLLRGEIDSYQMEKRYLHRGGDAVWIDLTVALQRDEAGEPLYSISVVQDISARKRIERELVEAKERAEAMAHLKSVFLANMSHEIRTPLTGILGFASLLARRVPEKYRTYAERIESAGQRLLDTLNAVLMLAKLEADRVDLELAPLRVAAEAGEVVQLFQASAKAKGLRLAFRRRGPDVAEAEALLDRGAFTSVLQNLLSNAIKFTDHGRVTVTVAVGEADGRVRVLVEDTGVGIDAAFLPYLFDEFRQESSGAGRHYEGAGLGLALAKRLAELMRGTLEVESEKDGGSRFTASFPLLERTSALPATSAPEGDAAAPPARLLIVEDNADARLLMGELLDGAHELTLAANAEEALRAARQAPHALVLLDINLGAGLSGEDVLRELRRLPAYRDVPVVALTAHGLPGDRERFLKMGFTAHLAKPFDVDALLELATTLAGGYEGREVRGVGG